ncbi:MAG: hypothetical protein IV090_19760 [Candidatus Sericytochromatia bacterium]|nr:hypothetical protein [Candidatus Sericytochromatia bacterium]
MQIKLNVCLTLMQSLLDSLQSMSNQSTPAEQILALEEAKKHLSQRLPVLVTSHRQQQALDVLKTEACMELFCNRRIEKIRESSLPESRKQSLIEELQHRYLNACQQLQVIWPVLEPQEEVVLPLLLLRQSVETEIENRIEALQAHNQAVQAGFWLAA